MNNPRLFIFSSWLLVSFIAVMVFLFPGVDLYTHLHFSWLYNYMIQHSTFLVYDFSMLNGEQFIYSVGMVSYVASGLLWFLAGGSTVFIVEVLSLFVLFIVSQRLFGKNMITPVWMALLALFILHSDTYPYFFSLTLFYLGIYLMHAKKHACGTAAVLLAGLNHPYISIASLVFLFGKNRLLRFGVVGIFLVQAFIFGYKFFSGVGYEAFSFALTLYIIPSVLIRTAVLFYPFFATLFFPGLAQKIRFAYIWPVLIVGLIVAFHINYTTEVPIDYKINCYYENKYSDVGKLDGNVRVVDICRNGLYSLPVQGNVLTVSPYFEGQEYYIYWEEQQYLEYLKEKQAKYVIHCKNCSWLTTSGKPANELEMLQKNFHVYSETGEYVIFRTG